MQHVTIMQFMMQPHPQYAMIQSADGPLSAVALSYAADEARSRAAEWGCRLVFEEASPEMSIPDNWVYRYRLEPVA